MALPIITTSLIMSWRPCRVYTANRVGHIIQGGKTHKECLLLDIEPHDLLWLFTHYYSHVSEGDLTLFLRMLNAYKLTDETRAHLELISKSNVSGFDKAFSTLTRIALDSVWNKRYCFENSRKQVIESTEKYLCELMSLGLERAEK